MRRQRTFIHLLAASATLSAGVAAAKPEPLAIATSVVESRRVDRYLRVTGSLLADEQAEVSAEVSGRIVETPGERGTRVGQGAALVRIAGSEASAQLQEAEANAAQIEARLGLAAGESFDRSRVPDVMNAKAALDLADADFARIGSLLDQKAVSQSEYDQRRFKPIDRGYTRMLEWSLSHRGAVAGLAALVLSVANSPAAGRRTPSPGAGG